MNQGFDLHQTIEDIKNGDQKAFKTIYDQYIGITKAIVYEYMQDQEIMNDHIQDIWELIFKKIPLYKHDNFKAWIRTIANNKCIDIYRRKKVMTIPTKEINDHTIYDDIPDDAEDPNLLNSTLDDIFTNLSPLTDRQGKILTLRIKGVPFKVISRKLNIPHGSCTSAYQAAIIKIRRELIKLGYRVTESTSLNVTNDRRKQ